jgi:hypothetical protein
MSPSLARPWGRLRPVFFIVGLVGLLVLGYLANLRLDAILYARQVNGVRHYFYCQSPAGGAQESTIRVLPRSINQPPYFEFRYFGFVVFALGVVDSAYVFGAFYLPVAHRSVPWGLVVLTIAFFLLHWGIYWWLCHYRDNDYMK